MNKSIEVTAKTEEEAVATALQQLGLRRDQVSVEVITRHKSGFLGIGSTPAKVRVIYSETRESVAKDFFEGLFKHMDVDAQVEVTTDEAGNLHAEFTGKNIGVLIGRRGETLDAIQHLAGYVVNKGESKRVRLSVDAENYRKKREETLQKLAEKVANKVLKYRKNVTLEPMNSYERHVIHVALQDWEEVTTYSIGAESNRRIVVAYSKNKTTANDE